MSNLPEERDVSFLGFPSVYIYATGVSSGAKKIDNVKGKYHHYLTSNKIKDDEKKLLPLDKYFNSFLTNNPPSDIDATQSVQDFINIEFDRDHFWSLLPMSFFLSFSSFKLGKYSEALKYWEQFMNKIGEKDNTYYNDIPLSTLYLLYLI